MHFDPDDFALDPPTMADIRNGLLIGLAVLLAFLTVLAMLVQ